MMCRKRKLMDFVHTDSSAMNDIDKIYLLLFEVNLQDIFNDLCFRHNVRDFGDLDNVNEETIKNPFMSMHSKKALNQLGQKAKEAHDFNELAKKHIKTNYREILVKDQVPIIPLEEVYVKRKLVSGPFSGVVCEAEWRKPDGTKERVCLRYDHGSRQRDGFLREARMAANLKHNNILQLHGVILPGTYTKCVALVLEFSEHGNFSEALPHLPLSSVLLEIEQLASALEYLESKKLLHSAISPAIIFMVAENMFKLGGFFACFRDEEFQKEGPFTHLAHRKKDQALWFGRHITANFVRVETQHSNNSRFSVLKEIKDNGTFSKLLPDYLSPMVKLCMTKGKSLPSFSNICHLLNSSIPPKLRVTSDFKGKSAGDLTCQNGDLIFLISKTRKRKGDIVSRKWFGETKSGNVGFFDGSKTEEVPRGSPDESFQTSLDGDGKVANQPNVPAEIRARGAEAELAYQRALRKGRVRVYRGRVMLIGQDRAGKTSLKKSLFGLPFDPMEVSTDGVEVDPSVFEVEVDQVKNWQRVEHGKYVSEFAEDIARLVVDELSQVANEKVEYDADSVTPTLDVQEETRPDEKELNELETPTCDTTAIQLTTPTTGEEAKRAQKLQRSSSLTDEVKTQIDSASLPDDVTKLVEKYLNSVKSDDGRAAVRESVVTVWDFAGQHLYYASHPVFLSPRAIYVLVYNLSKDLNALAEPCVRQGVHDIVLDNANAETNLDSILSWLVSVHSMRPAGGTSQGAQQASGSVEKELPYLRPPVIIVGSHEDRPYEEPKRMEAHIKKSLSGKVYEQHVLRPLFRVNNTKSGEDEGVRKVRQKINEVFDLEPYMGEDVPMRWFNFEKVAEVLAQKKLFYLNVPKVQRLLREMCYIEDEAEVEALLHFYHDLGVIIWHGETVILQAQWLIDLFKKLITVRPFDEQNPRHAEAWRELEQSGLLDTQLIDHVFSNFLHGDQSKEDMLSMMEMYGLIAKFTVGPSQPGDKAETKYFVPAQLCSSPQTLLEVQPSESDPCPLFVHFLDGFLPHGLFPQVVSGFIRLCPDFDSRHAPNLFQNLVRFILGATDDHDLLIICKKRFLKLILRRLQPKPAVPAQDCTAVRVRSCLETILSDLSRDYASLRYMRYEVCVACPSCATGSRQREQSCARDDCMHLLPVSRDGRMVCTRTFDERSRADISGLDDWYREDVVESDQVAAVPDLLAQSRVSTHPTPAEHPVVFISYQWGMQDTVKKLRNQIEEHGFKCWMDIGQMGGGDALYAELDAGIRAAKVMIVCVTQKYCESENCQRETTLADSLRIPVVPLLFEEIPWPPAGQLSLIFAKLLYVDMTQGSGDVPEEKFDDLMKRIKKYVER